MAAVMYPDPEKKRNRGYLGYDSSALPPRDRQARRRLLLSSLFFLFCY
jgi:hypothetical protein